MTMQQKQMWNAWKLSDIHNITVIVESDRHQSISTVMISAWRTNYLIKLQHDCKTADLHGRNRLQKRREVSPSECLPSVCLQLRFSDLAKPSLQQRGWHTHRQASSSLILQQNTQMPAATIQSLCSLVWAKCVLTGCYHIHTNASSNWRLDN